jgi:hypothetical protein
MPITKNGWQIPIDMDSGIALTPDEVKGRNAWIVWTGDNDRFWDEMTASTFGAVELLKSVAYDPAQKIDRDRRWTYLGLINESWFDAPTRADANRFVLLLDVRQA